MCMNIFQSSLVYNVIQTCKSFPPPPPLPLVLLLYFSEGFYLNKRNKEFKKVKSQLLAFFKGFSISYNLSLVVVVGNTLNKIQLC